MKRLLYTLLALLLLSPVTGELLRIPAIGFDLLPSDIFIVLFYFVWGIDKVKNDRVVRIGKIGKYIFIFLFVLTVTYLLNLYRFPPAQMKDAFIYLVRFGAYSAVAFPIYDLLVRDKKKRLLWIMLLSYMVGALLIAIFGFLQLKYFGNFLEMGLYLQGWDPHIGRLTSTWLDPNFIGGYLAFILGISVSMGLYFRHSKNKWRFLILAGLSAFLLIALYLTFSRSGYLALIATLGILAFFKSRKLLVAFILVSVLAFAFSPRIQQRVTEATDSGKAFLGLDTQKPLDPTAELRVWSWTFAREIILDYPVIGAGFSRYKYEINSRGHGLLSDHASGGSDSSLLTIWATSGFFGLIAYLTVGFVAFVTAFKRMWHKNDLKSYLLAGLTAGYAGILVHSVFVNSLLYTLMMVQLYSAIALMDYLSSREGT